MLFLTRARLAWRLLGLVTRRWNSLNIPRLAASLTYYTMVSLTPILVIMVAAVGFVFGSDEARAQLVGQVSAQLGIQGARVVDAVIQNIAAPGRGIIATLVSSAVILLGATSLFTELKQQLNIIWRVRPSDSSQIGSLLRGRMEAFAMLVAVGICLLLATGAGFAVATATKRVEHWIPASDGVLEAGDIVFSLLLGTVLFSLVYRFVPDRQLHWRHLFGGAAATALLFVAGRIAIGYYISKASVGSAYGAAGSLVAFLVWLYYCSQVFLIGAILTNILARTSRIRAARRRRRPRKAA